MAAPLELEWAFGINSNVPNCVHLLANNDADEGLIFYPVSNNGVIYNTERQTQTFLSRHTDIITSAIVSVDKSLLLMGDSGASESDSIISVWSGSTFELLATHRLPPHFGVKALAINAESTLIAAIVNEALESRLSSNQMIQHLMLWSLSEAEDEMKSEESEESMRMRMRLVFAQKIKNNYIEKKLYHFLAFDESSTELVMHGQVMENFAFWSVRPAAEAESLELVPYYSDAADNVNNCDLTSIGALTASCFLPRADGALITATNSGDLIHWQFDVNAQAQAQQQSSSRHRTIAKVIPKITRGAINCVSVLRNNEVIVLASSSGYVRFYDLECRVIGWFDSPGDQVCAVSFPLSTPRYSSLRSFAVPEMLIGTKQNKIIRVSAHRATAADAAPRARVVVDTFNAVCTAMSAHPKLPLLAVADERGHIEIWDLRAKRLIHTLRPNQNHTDKITQIAFSANGEWLAFGSEAHYLRIYELSEDALEWSEAQAFKSNFDGAIANLCFSRDSEWLAFSQAQRVSVYRFWFGLNDVKREKAKEWVLCGNHLAHHSDVVAMHFAAPSALDAPTSKSVPRLFSIGRGHLCNEYNLLRSAPNLGLRIKFTFRLTPRSAATAMHFLAVSAEAAEKENLVRFDEARKEWRHCEDLLLFFDDEFKVHFYHSPRSVLSVDAITARKRQREEEAEAAREAAEEAEAVGDGVGDGDAKSAESEEEQEALAFRRTVLGPSFGAPVQKVVQLSEDVLLFCTASQVIGMAKGPLNGSPHRYFGTTAHPGRIHGFELVQLDRARRVLATNGGYDRSLFLWRIDGAALEAQVAQSREESELDAIFRELIGEELFGEIRNYFYFVQIEEQGSISTAPRSISGSIRLEQITSIFQAMGSFLTRSDVERIRKEMAHRFNAKEIALEQFCELFVNYRSTFELSVEELHRCFTDIIGVAAEDEISNSKEKNNSKKGKGPLGVGDRDALSMTREFFLDVLQKKGDKMSRDEMMSCFEALTGYKRRELSNVMPSNIDPQFFTANILGLRECQQDCE